jgi:hypothetical protein
MTRYSSFPFYTPLHPSDLLNHLLNDRQFQIKRFMSVDYPKLDSCIPWDLLCFSKITVISKRQSIGRLPFKSCL